MKSTYKETFSGKGFKRFVCMQGVEGILKGEHFPASLY